MADRGEEWDVVVVGAGTSGCPLAARLADAGRRVLLLEAGADHRGDFPAALRSAATLGAAVPGHPANWSLSALLTERVRAVVPRGRVVGGSSALNGGYFIRGAPADFDGWAAEGNSLWSYAQVLPAFRRLEADADFGADAAHGADGPLPVRRVPSASPVAEAFAAATAQLGFPAEPDKNAGAEPGYGPIPFTVVDGVRINTAMAYLSPRRGSPALTVRGGVAVRRVVVEGGRAVGVATDDGVLRAGEVVLSAGAVGSPHLLLLSGIGPADALRRAGVPVVADLPGVGAQFTDHPHVYVSWRPVRPLPAAPEMLPLCGVLNTRADGLPGPGNLELLPWLLPFAQVMREPGESAGADDDLAVGVGLQQEESRGRLSLVDADPRSQPRLEYRYLTAEADRRRLRHGVRLAAELLRTPPLAELVAERVGLPEEVLGDDRELDRWVARSIATAVHLSGTARMGPDSDSGAVVDQQLRVRGVAGLRVVDTSVLPRAPSRGTAATAVMLGERAAELLLD